MSSLKIDIPEQDFISFEELLVVDNNTLEDISKYLSSVNKDNSFEEIENGIKKVTKHSKLIFGLVYTFCRIDLSVNQFIAELYDFYKRNSLKPVDKNFFEKKLSNIISDDLPIKFVVKSKVLEATNQRIFYESKIITDIRPIFKNKDGEELIGKVIVNQLKITFGESSKRKEFFITLDLNDLNQLKQTIERAERKVKLLETIKL